jgi:TolA-binding protein
VLSSLAFSLALSFAPALFGPRQDVEGDRAYAFLVALVERGLDEELAREARSFLERFPRHPKVDLARYRLASALFDLGRHADARTELRRLVRNDGFELASEALFRLGQCELALGDAKAAVAAFEGAGSVAGEYLRAPCALYLGEAWFRAGDFDRAATSYRRAAELAPRTDTAREAEVGLAWCDLRTQRNDDAVRRCEALLAADRRSPRAGELHVVAGEAHLAAGRPREALAHFESVGDGTAAEGALRGAAFAAAALGEHRRAAQLFGELATRFPDGAHSAEAALHRGVELVRAGEARAAVAALSDRRVPAEPESDYWRARAAFDAGDPAAALDRVEGALAGRPAGDLTDRLHALRGDALAALGRASEAAEAYRRVDTEAGARAAAVAAFAAGRVGEAADLAAGWLDRYPASVHRAELLYIAGEGDLEARALDRAERRFLEAHAAASDGALRARALSRAAWCAYLRDDFAAAAARFERVAREHADAPEADEAAYLVARARESSGDTAGALASYRRYVAEGPRDPGRGGEAWTAIARLDPTDSAALERALDHAPESRAAPLLLARGERLAAEGDHTAAIASFRELLARFADADCAPRARYGLAWSASQSGDLPAADDALRQRDLASTRDAGLAIAAGELAVFVRSKRGDVEGAIAAYRGLAELGAGDARCDAAARLVARALATAGRAAEADRCLAERAEATRDRAGAFELALERAWIALDAEHLDAADAAARAAFDLAPAGAERARAAEACLFAAEARFEAGDDARAIPLYEIAAASCAEERRAGALYKLGFARLRSGAHAAAADAFARVVGEHASSEVAGESAYLLGEARSRGGDLEHAVEAFDLVQKRWPRHEVAPKALVQLAIALGALGRWKECERAIAALDRAGVPRSAAAEIDLVRGRALAARGEARAARAAFERAIERDDRAVGARARLAIADLARASGDLEGALSEYLRVALLYASEDDVARALYAAGECLEALGRVDKAAERYRELAEAHAEHALAARAKERLAALRAR